jgi:hypothetical protein
MRLGHGFQPHEIVLQINRLKPHRRTPERNSLKKRSGEECRRRLRPGLQGLSTPCPFLGVSSQ